MPGCTAGSVLVRYSRFTDRSPPRPARLADALAAPHEKGCLHGDVKPSNIGFTAEGSPKLLDFGLAQAVDDAAMVGGTLPYLSPEVLAGRTAGEADDVWALSVVLYEMVSGRHPFGGGALEEVQSRIRLRGVDPAGPPGGAAGGRDRLRRRAGRAPRERVAEHFSNYFQPACPVLSCHTSLDK